MPTPCLLALASSPSPSSHFLPLNRVTQAIVSACAKPRGGKAPVGWGQMHKGWDFLKPIGCQQRDTFSHSSRSDLHLLLLDPDEGFQPWNVQSAVCGPLLSMRVKITGSREGKKREFTRFCKLIWDMGRHYQPFLESGPGASEASDFPTLTCLAESSFTSSRGTRWSQPFSVFWWGNSYIGKFSTERRFNPLNFWIAVCLCLSNKNKLFGF